MIVSTLEHPEQHHLWPGIRELLGRASRRFGAEPWNESHLVWIVIDGRQIIGAFTTTVDEGEMVEVVNVAGHRIREWLPLAEQHVEMLGRLAGAARLRSSGRKGWERLNASLGWHVAGQDGNRVIYEKAL